MLKGMNPSYYDFGLNHDEIYGSDEFRMYAYKIKQCSRMCSHDWTECPYAHRGEKAQRRDPRYVPYFAIACPAFRKGKCLNGDACEFAHGVFEYWLHPARYRTRACNAGVFCQRKVCFFAHTPDQLRSKSKYKCHNHFLYKGRPMDGGDRRMVVGNNGPTGGGGECSTHHDPSTFAGSPYLSSMGYYCGCEGFLEILKRSKALKMRDGEKRRSDTLGSGGGGFEASDSDLPHVEWISELVT